MMKNIFQMDINIPLASVNKKYVNRKYALTKEYSVFKSSLSLLARMHYKWRDPSSVELSVILIVWTRKDIDNVIKPIIDAMQGIVFVNDSQIRHIDVKRFNAGKKMERLSIKVIEGVII